MKQAQLEKMDAYLLENSMVIRNDDSTFSPRFIPQVPLNPRLHTDSLAAALDNARVPDIDVDYLFYNDINVNEPMSNQPTN
ncbi:MAG: hypothetical protein COB51_12640 [Moraxellaceae bacterium]|nr:MAG: hypothetical protein COB51_12640 [Moraxellaceae bacterium]